MAPALGPTTALAMCAAAFVGWRAPSQPAQTAKLEVPEPTSTDKPVDPEMHTVLSGINVSSDFCESTFLREHAWQQWDTTLKTTSASALGVSDENLGDGEMAHAWESEKGAIKFAQGGTSNLHNISIPVIHNRTQNMQWSHMQSALSGEDHSESFFNRDSKKVSIDFNYEGFFTSLNESGFDQEACPKFATCQAPIVNKSEPRRFPVRSAESRTGFHTGSFGSLNEVAVMATETVSEVPPHSSDVLDIHAEILLPLDSIRLVDDVTAVSMTQMHQVKQEAPKVWTTQGHDESSSFQSMLDKFFEFLRVSWQVCCTECRKMISDDKLDIASQALEQWWHTSLATSQSVLGEDLFLRVSELVVRWWQVALLCFASLCDLVLFGVFGSFLLRKVASFCCCGRRRGSVSVETGFADTTKIDHCGKQNLPSDEPKEITRSSSGTSQVPAQMFDDVPCDLAREGGSVESAIKGQRSPFNSAIQVRSVPTPARRVAAGHAGFASS